MDDLNKTVAIAAAFFSGFNKLMGLQLCLNGSYVTLLRFGISPAKIGCFIGDAGASMYFWGIWGILLSFGLSFFGWTGRKAFIAPGSCTAIYCLAFFYACYVKRFSDEGGILPCFVSFIPVISVLFMLAKFKNGENGKYVCPIVSCISSLCSLITFSIIFNVVAFGHGIGGVSKLYYWLCISALSQQFDTNMATKVNGKFVAWFFLAMELSYFVAPFLHWFCERFHKVLGLHDLNFFIVFGQAMSMCAFATISVELCMINIYVNWDSYLSESADMDVSASFKRCLSPFFMGVLGMGSIFWLFPVIWPFMVCHYSCLRFFVIFAAVLSTAASLIPWVLSDGHQVAKLFTTLGPLFDIKDKTHFNIWGIGESTNGGWRYHLFWCLFIFIFVFFWIIVSCIHYPRCLVARCVLHSRWAVVCGSFSFFLAQLIKAVGLSGCFANAIGPVFVSGGLSVPVFRGTVKIEDDAVTGNRGIKISNFGIALNNTKKKITGTFTQHVLRGAVSLSGKPSIILHGFVGVVKTSTLTPHFGSTGTFQGKNSSIILSSETLDLGLFSGAYGGPDANLIVSLIKIEIKGLDMTAGEEDDGEWFSISSDDEEEKDQGLRVTVSGEAKNVERIDITLGFTGPITGFPNSSGDKVFRLSGAQLDTENCSALLYCSDGVSVASSSISGMFFSTSGLNNVTIDSYGYVSIDALQFRGRGLGLTIRGFDHASFSGNISSSISHTVILYGLTASTKSGKSKPATVGFTVPSGISFSRDSAVNMPKGTLKLATTNVDKNLELNSAHDQETEGLNKAGNFNSSEQGDYLTRMDISLFLEPAKYISIDGFPVGGKAIMAFDFGAGIKGSGNGFNFNQNSLNQRACCITFPADFAHGATFGTVCLDLSLFHMTAALFTTQAYSVGYRSFKCAVDSGCSWPTQGIGGLRSFGWWLGYGLKNGNKRFWNLADLDIIHVIS